MNKSYQELGLPSMAEYAMAKKEMEYKVPSHLRGEIDLNELKKDLDKLNEPLVDGMFNLCYGDGYFQKSLVRKYGKSIIELEKILKDFDVYEKNLGLK